MAKVQLTLSDQEVSILTGYGDRLGYSLPKMVRFVVTKAAEQYLKEIDIPTYQMSEKTEDKGLRALAESKAGKTTNISDVGSFFDSL